MRRPVAAPPLNGASPAVSCAADWVPSPAMLKPQTASLLVWGQPACQGTHVHARPLLHVYVCIS